MNTITFQGSLTPEQGEKVHVEVKEGSTLAGEFWVSPMAWRRIRDALYGAPGICIIEAITLLAQLGGGG